MKFIDGDAVVLLRMKDGSRVERRIACNAAVDDDASMREHVRRFIPSAEYLGVRIERRADGQVLLNTQVNDGSL